MLRSFGFPQSAHDDMIYVDSNNSAGPVIVQEQTLRLSGLFGLESDIVISLANSDEDRDSACRLVNERYGWRGYGSNHVIPTRKTHTTFTVSQGDDTIGTLTLAVDSSAGLAADDIFRDEINTFRRIPGAKVCELTKLAFNSGNPSKPTLAALFHIMLIYGQRKFNCSDLFIEVNPRHRRFYESMLGFRRIGDLKTNESVDAPSQLMWLKVADIRDQVDDFAGQGDSAATRSLYPFFFPIEEEKRIAAQLATMSEPQAPAAVGNGLSEDITLATAPSLTATASSFPNPLEI